MSTTDWILVAGAIGGGILLGLLIAKVITLVLGSPKRPDPLRQAAGPLSSLGFWAGVITGLLVALGILSPSSLEQLPKDLIAYLPNVLAAVIIMIAAKVIAEFATAALAPMLARTPTSVQRQVSGAVRSLVLGLAVLLSIRQLGVDTTVINLGVAAVFFGVAGSLTLLVGLGGRNVASEVASTRAVRRLINIGDHVQVNGVSGRVIDIHPTAVELDSETDGAQLVPSSQLLEATITVTRKKDLELG